MYVEQEHLSEEEPRCEEVEKKEEEEETSKLVRKSEEAYPDNLEKIWWEEPSKGYEQLH